MAARGDRQAAVLTVTEAGQELGVSLSTVWRMIRSGRLPSYRKGGRRWVPRRDLYSRAVRRHVERIPRFTKDHPIFRLAGAYRSGGVGPGSEDKHAILDR